MEYLFNFVYLSYEETANGRSYVGQHSTNNINDGYLGSYSDKSFNPTSRIILEYCKTKVGALAAEIRWQRALKVAEDSDFANRSYQTSTRFVYPWRGKKRSEEDKMNKSKASKGKPKSESHRKKLSEARRNIKLSESHKRNIGLSGLGREVTKQTRDKISKSKLGTTQSEEHIKKLSLIRKGKKWWNNGLIETQSHEPPSPDWTRGRIKGRITGLDQG